VLLNTWCENAATFQGFWPTRISALALCALLRAERPSLQVVVVKGDIIITATTKNSASFFRLSGASTRYLTHSVAIMTRSKTRVGEWVSEGVEGAMLISCDTEPPQFTRVQFPVKALKLLLHELQTNGEVSTLAGPTAPLDAESDDGDSDWSDEEKIRDDRFSYLADVMGAGGLSFDEDDVLVNNDDEDLRKDPVSQIDLRAHVTSFIRESAARDADGFGSLVGQLSAEEMIVVQRALQEQS